MTRLEVLRTGSIEEVVDVLFDASNTRYCRNFEECVMQSLYGEDSIDDGQCRECMLEWLKEKINK